MNTKDLKYAYFIGAGGIGMSALIRYFLFRGIQVFGYDKTPSELTDALIKEGAEIIFDDDQSHAEHFLQLPSNEAKLIIYTPAIPSDLGIRQILFNSSVKVMKRAEVLGLITKSHKTIAVAGTHGKTTTSSLIAHLLHHAGLSPWAFLGGISSNLMSNFLKGKENGWVVVEADEYDRSFLYLNPDIAVITSTEADHLDIYKEDSALKDSFNQFAQQVKHSLIVSSNAVHDIHDVSAVVKDYGLFNQQNSAQSIHVNKGHYVFDLQLDNLKIESVALGMAGLHNVENAVGASVAALLVGVKPELLKNGLSTFKGVQRRFEYIINTENTVFIDDYAHHPTELKACINSVKELHPTKRITGVFQPHLYSRTRDFYQEFADSLDLLDEILLLDIYPARELPIEGVSSSELLKKCKNPNKKLLKKEELIPYLTHHQPEVLLTLGAGDIDRLVQPIADHLNQLKPSH